MKQKKGAGGKLQYYDWRGRYCSNPNSLVKKDFKESKKEQKRRKAENRINSIRNIIVEKNDPDVRKVFEYLLTIYPKNKYFIQKVNSIYTSPIDNTKRELDIETEKCIIEIKRSKKPGCLTQLLAQQAYANLYRKGKTVVVYDELIRPNAKYDLEKHGFRVFTNLTDLKNL